MSQCTDPEYTAMFPTVEERMDLLAISRLCRKGRYSCDEGDSNSSYTKNTSGTIFIHCLLSISFAVYDIRIFAHQNCATSTYYPFKTPDP